MGVSTSNSRLTIRKLLALNQSSLQVVEEMIDEPETKKLFSSINQEDNTLPWDAVSLPSKLSIPLIKALAKDSKNHDTLESVLTFLHQLISMPDNKWAVDDAIQSSKAVFGIQKNVIPSEIDQNQDMMFGSDMIGVKLLEDNVVRTDASQFPGFDAIAPDLTGKAVFEKRNEKLTIYIANKLPLEEMFGVDLIYINETKGNIVMVQYKMLEESNQKNGASDWLFRPNEQLDKEIKRMMLPLSEKPFTDYRLNHDPFFFKFVKRKVVGNSHQSFIISLGHLKRFLDSSQAKGPRGGLRISQKGLNGSYLREDVLFGLIRSGYIGTHQNQTQHLEEIISLAARGDRATVLSWQRKRKDQAPVPEFWKNKY